MSLAPTPQPSLVALAGQQPVRTVVYSGKLWDPPSKQIRPAKVQTAFYEIGAPLEQVMHSLDIDLGEGGLARSEFSRQATYFGSDFSVVVKANRDGSTSVQVTRIQRKSGWQSLVEMSPFRPSPSLRLATR